MHPNEMINEVYARRQTLMQEAEHRRLVREAMQANCQPGASLLQRVTASVRVLNFRPSLTQRREVNTHPSVSL
jgi:hypothetical protein